MKHGLQIIDSWEFLDGPYATFIDMYEIGDRISIVFSENGHPRIIDTTVEKIAYNNAVDVESRLTRPRQLYLESERMEPYILETDGKLIQLKTPTGTKIPEVDIYRLERISGENNLHPWIQWKVKFRIISVEDDDVYIWFTRAPQSSLAKQRAETQLLSKYAAVEIIDVETT